MFFFFKQKTAYEMRISDWSSDVCSSDLHERIGLWDAELDREALLAELPTGDYGAVVARIHAAYARAKGKRCWANVDIATLDNMDLVNAWFGNARFLPIVRHGRDVALSPHTTPYVAAHIAQCPHPRPPRTP